MLLIVVVMAVYSFLLSHLSSTKNPPLKTISQAPPTPPLPPSNSKDNSAMSVAYHYH